MHKRVKSTLDGVYRIRDVARALGTFARVERDEAYPLNLTQVIETAINMAFNEIKYRARLQKNSARNLPLTLGNEGRLSQVFVNLLINATHAVDDGAPESNVIAVRTVIAVSGISAKKLLQKDQSFDLIICDMMMPEVSGMDLHRW